MISYESHENELTKNKVSNFNLIYFHYIALIPAPDSFIHISLQWNFLKVYNLFLFFLPSWNFIIAIKASSLPNLSPR